MSEFTTKVLEDGTLEIVKLVSKREEVVEIPSKIDGKVVTKIGMRAFYMRTALLQIILPNTIRYIDKSAFVNCSRLIDIFYLGTIEQWCKIEGLQYLMGATSKCTQLHINHQTIGGHLVLPNTITEIGSYAFARLNSITSLIIPNSVKKIEKSAFLLCERLEKVVFEEGGTELEIGDSVFASCGKIKILSLPSHITKVGNHAFFGINRVVPSIYDNGKYYGSKTNPYLVLLNKVHMDQTGLKIHDGCKIICSGALSYLRDEVQEVYIPKDVVYIGEYAFKGSFIADLSFEEGSKLKYIGKEAFAENYYIKNIPVPDTVDYIGDRAFWRCQDIQKMILPKNLSYLGDDALAECSDLKYLYIGNNIKKFNKTILFDCRNLQKIKFEEGFDMTGFDRKFFIRLPKLQTIEIGTVSTRNIAMALLLFGITRKDASLIQEKYMDLLYKKDMMDLINLAKDYGYVSALQLLAVKYNKRFGNTNLDL